MQLNTKTHPYCARVADLWSGWFSNAAVAAETAKWNATRYESGAARVGHREWSVVDENRQRWICGGVGNHEDERRLAG